MIQGWTKDVKTWILWGTGDEPSETSNDIDSPSGPELEDIEDNETESNEAHAMNNERDTNGKDTPSSSTPKEDVISVALLTNPEAYASHMEEISLQKKRNKLSDNPTDERNDKPSHTVHRVEEPNYGEILENNAMEETGNKSTEKANREEIDDDRNFEE